MENVLRTTVERRLEEHAARVFVVMESERPPRTVTYGHVAKMVAVLRPQLRRLGVRPGTILAIQTSSCPESVALVFATILEGGAFVCIGNQNAGPERVRAVLGHLAPVGLVFDRSASTSALASAAAHWDFFRPVYFESPNLPDTWTLPAPHAHLELPRLSPVRDALEGEFSVDGRRGNEDVSCVILTSGSTGGAKGAAALDY